MSESGGGGDAGDGKVVRTLQDEIRQTDQQARDARLALALEGTPPWVTRKSVSKLAERARTGSSRQLMQPPPWHIPVSPPEVEAALVEPGSADYKKRLEDRAKEQGPSERPGNVCYDDTAPYVEPQRQTPGTTPSSMRWGADTLVFESRFESGNLRKVVQVGIREYDLTLRSDHESHHVQWFYFMVSNVRKCATYVFNITNFAKPKSLYNQGLRPLMYSTQDAETRGVGWVRSGTRIAYYQRGKAYTLTFSIMFPYDCDRCFLAHCYPYTYSDLQLSLMDLEADEQRGPLVTRTELCRTLAGNRVDLLTITQASPEQRSQEQPKPSILLSARVHPGETQASWMMAGTIKFLTSDLPEARLLRERFVIYVVPMLNPDGVIHGNYRCGLSGQDLNRVWDDPDAGRHPTIYHTKELMRELAGRGLVFFCDFHGHSTKRNAFMYGCDSEKAGGSKEELVFPLIMAEHSPAFSFPDCDFQVRRQKVTTGRVVVCKEFGIGNSYTLEVSFLGHKVAGQLLHFSAGDLSQLGHQFGEMLVRYHLPSQYEALKEDSLPAEVPTPPPDVGEQPAREGGEPASEEGIKPSEPDCPPPPAQTGEAPRPASPRSPQITGWATRAVLEAGGGGGRERQAASPPPPREGGVASPRRQTRINSSRQGGGGGGGRGRPGRGQTGRAGGGGGGQAASQVTRGQSGKPVGG